MQTKRAAFGLVLWASYILTMAASIGHLAWTFGTLEPAGMAWAGWLPALAVDAGLAALAYAIQQRKRAKRPTRALWGGVAVFAGISAYANALHALHVAPGDIFRALILSAVLPLLVVYLGEIISADDVAAADAADAAAMREMRRIEREQARMDAERAAQASAYAPEQAAHMRTDAPASPHHANAFPHNAAAYAEQPAHAAPTDAAAVRSDAARRAARARWDAAKGGSNGTVAASDE